MARKLIGQNIQTHWVTRAGLEGIGALHGLTFAPISPIPVRTSPEKKPRPSQSASRKAKALPRTLTQPPMELAANVA